MQALARRVDLSGGGAGVLYSAAAETGAVKRLSFNVPVAQRLATLSIQSLVRHNHLRSDGHLIGFRFRDLNDAYLAALRRFTVATKGMRTQS